jgi:hypothetical protein
MSQKSAACARNHEAASFFSSRLHEISGRVDVSLNAKTNGNGTMLDKIVLPHSQ